MSKKTHQHSTSANCSCEISSSTQTTHLISQLYKRVISNEVESQDKLKIILLKENEYCIRIGKYFNEVVRGCNSKIDQKLLECVREVVVVSAKIVSETQFYKCFEHVGEKQLIGFANYIQKQSNEFALDSCVVFIQKMFLEHGCQIYSNGKCCQSLFKSIVAKFVNFSSDQVKEMATEILVEMLTDNKKLIKYANKPHYFIEFWLRAINRETDLDKQLYWIGYVNQLYQTYNNSSQTLFYENDFKVFIDLLLRVMNICSNRKQLKIPLMCYLTLSVETKMIDNMLRIDDVKQFIREIERSQQEDDQQLQEIMDQILSIETKVK